MLQLWQTHHESSALAFAANWHINPRVWAALTLAVGVQVPHAQ